MKKTLIITLIVVLCASSVAFSAQATRNITVTPNTATITVNGEKVTSDNFNYNGTIYVPLRGVFEKAGFNVGWDQGTKTAAITEPDNSRFTEYTILLYEFRNITYFHSLLSRAANNINGNSLLTIKNLKDVIAESEKDFIFGNSQTMYYSDDTYIKGTYEKACELYETMLALADAVIEAKSTSSKFNDNFVQDMKSVEDDAIQYGDSVFSIYMAEIKY
jgi:hypothetical protein